MSYHSITANKLFAKPRSIFAKSKVSLSMANLDYLEQRLILLVSYLRQVFVNTGDNLKRVRQAGFLEPLRFDEQC